MNRRVAINLVAFLGVFVLMLWWAVNNIITFDFIERPYEIEGRFAATAGVAPNSEVAYLGVNYGSVSKVESVDGGVVITMSIDRDKEIPAGSVARIFRKSAIGEPYIDFDPPDDYEEGDPTIEPGTVIPEERTRVPLEFSELLRAASRILQSVEPEQTRTLVHELAVALEGRGETLRDLTVSSDALLATFAERTELLDSLSANSTRLTRTVTERRAAMSSAVADLAALAETLRAVEPDTTVLLDRGTELLGQTADLVADVKDDLDCILHDLNDVIELTGTDANLENLRATLERGPAGLNYVWMTRDDEPGGLWVRVNLLLETANPTKQYVPPRELPPVPEVPGCVSTLGSGGDVRFDGSGATLGGVVVSGSSLPATGGDTAPVVILVLLAGAAISLAARRSAGT
jgi:phospholipid/cholesterol/gamma-HCH transport system substrate-binding protein